MFIGYLETTRAVAPTPAAQPSVQPVTPDRSGQ
jgi:hypothetical protein